MTTVLENLHVYINLHIDEVYITRSINNLHSTMSCVLSAELAPTPLEAVQVMVVKVLSLITLVALRVLVTLNVVMASFVELVMTRVAPSSVKGIPSKNQEMVGAGTPVAMHISAPEAPSEMVTVGFWESKMAATGVTGGDEKLNKMVDETQGVCQVTYAVTSH